MSSTIRGFDDYLESLPPITFRRLYQQPATTLAIFRRMLPNLAKVFVTTLLYNETPIPQADLEVWARPESSREREDALGKLRRLFIIKEENGQISLDPAFKKNFRLALTGGGDHHSFGVPVRTPEKKKIDLQFLDQYAAKQFDTILHFMVQTASNVHPSEGVKHLLVTSGLMERHGGRSEPTITQNGFSFLLQAGNAQIWVLLIQYLEMSETLGMEKTDVLHFLLMLGSLDLGRAYAVETLTQTQKSMLADLRDYGVVYQRKTTSDCFYPTRLATTLTSDSSGLRSVSESFNAALTVHDPSASTTIPPAPSSLGPVEKGFIMIETNYRIYAYTSSPLQIAVLDLFCNLSSRFPNFVTGKLSRRSIQSAIKLGITADQIIDYLRTHAHVQMRKISVLVLPPTVVDQIRLWEIEGERMKTTTGYLFKEFATVMDWEETRRYAEELGVLRWAGKEQRMLFVTRHEGVADWLKRRAVKLQQQQQMLAAKKAAGT
ncbi:putative TFIIH and nucleotide excision repair factor 3 complexes subunit [Ascodesmis nigricans]|uniref:RNA polymerase II transcription factor B subunit 2 n=1 Tax=Ascodesmis nigricans TaxID=341454 RepID=A0A4S2N4E3_9PEZI|nr:putative TFIIH and nucleotide excision repair factor 3 complexes subunit [Ascodesmis nigricans]